MNWTRLFPALLAAHRQLGAVCSGSPSETTPRPSATQGPALAMIAAAVLAWGVLAPPLSCPDRPGFAQDGVQPPTSTDLSVATRIPVDDTPALPLPHRPVPSVQGVRAPGATLLPTSDCSGDASHAAFLL